VTDQHREVPMAHLLLEPIRPIERGTDTARRAMIASRERTSRHAVRGVPGADLSLQPEYAETWLLGFAAHD
jgi:hypothetical protein